MFLLQMVLDRCFSSKMVEEPIGDFRALVRAMFPFGFLLRLLGVTTETALAIGFASVLTDRCSLEVDRCERRKG